MPEAKSRGVKCSLCWKVAFFSDCFSQAIRIRCSHFLVLCWQQKCPKWVQHIQGCSFETGNRNKHVTIVFPDISWYFQIFFGSLTCIIIHITHSPSANSWSFYPGRASAIITAARISRCSRHWSSAANPALLLMRFHLFSNPLKLLTFEWGHGLINPWHSNIRNKSQAIVQRTFCKSTPCRVIKWLNERMK